MPLNCGCCCCSSRDTESVSDKSWTAGAVNKSFENVEKTVSAENVLSLKTLTRYVIMEIFHGFPSLIITIYKTIF